MKIKVASVVVLALNGPLSQAKPESTESERYQAELSRETTEWSKIDSCKSLKIDSQADCFSETLKQMANESNITITGIVMGLSKITATLVKQQTPDNQKGTTLEMLKAQLVSLKALHSKDIPKFESKDPEIKKTNAQVSQSLKETVARSFEKVSRDPYFAEVYRDYKKIK